jgi:hypothetical protein
MSEKPTSTTKGNGADAEKAQRAPLVGEPKDFQIFEQVSLRWRHVAKAGTGTEDLKHPDYLSGIASKLSDYDLVDVYTADGRLYWQCVVVQGGRDGLSGRGGGRARMTPLPGFPMELPVIDRLANAGLPDGYSIPFDGFRRVHVPMWGTVPLNADGMPNFQDAHDVVIRHAAQAASIPPRPAR